MNVRIHITRQSPNGPSFIHVKRTVSGHEAESDKVGGNRGSTTLCSRNASGSFVGKDDGDDDDDAATDLGGTTRTRGDLSRLIESRLQLEYPIVISS